MTELIAALPMYDWPEVRAETDAFWANLREVLRELGVDAPEGLVRCNGDLPAIAGGIRDGAGRLIASDPAELPRDDLDLPTLWRHPALLFAQTCWGPMEQGLGGEVVVVGQPDYSQFEGGEGQFYSSAILMRQEDARTLETSDLQDLIPALRGKRFAFNGLDSMSGLIALERDLQSIGQGPDLFAGRVETGSHRASIRALAESRADICTVDCHTWDLATRFEPMVEELAVVGWTAKRRGLPFIASRHLPGATIQAVREAVSLVVSTTASHSSLRLA
jgi:ABC-type phosphate/phosphonate transport system substrate-binding protein